MHPGWSGYYLLEAQHGQMEIAGDLVTCDLDLGCSPGPLHKCFHLLDKLLSILYMPNNSLRFWKHRREQNRPDPCPHVVYILVRINEINNKIYDVFNVNCHGTMPHEYFHISALSGHSYPKLLVTWAKVQWNSNHKDRDFWRDIELLISSPWSCWLTFFGQWNQSRPIYLRFRVI